MKARANKKEHTDWGSEWKPRNDEPLGAYIRRVRIMRGLNLPDVARATAHLPSSQRVSHPYLSHIELGVVFRPEPERLQSIARVLGIPEAWILEKAGYNADGTISESAYVESSPSSQQIKTDIAQLDPADREWLLPMLEAIMRIRRAEGKAGER